MIKLKCMGTCTDRDCQKRIWANACADEVSVMFNTYVGYFHTVLIILTLGYVTLI